MTLYLHGMGHFHPENEISNRFLEDLDIGTTEEWIVERVGIHCRRTVLPLDYIRETRNRDVHAAQEAALYDVAEVGARAATLAIARAGIDRSQIGMVIAGSSASDYPTPAEACNVARKLGVEVPAFDVNSACSGFQVHLHLLAMMRPEALPNYVLVVTPECMTKVTDYADRSTAVLFGDAGAAAVVSTRVPSRARVLSTSVDSSPAGARKVVLPRTGHFYQEGRTYAQLDPRRIELGKQIYRTNVEERYNIGMVGFGGFLNGLHITRNNMRNVPKNHYSVPTGGVMESYYFEDGIDNLHHPGNRSKRYGSTTFLDPEYWE